MKHKESPSILPCLDPAFSHAFLKISVLPEEATRVGEDRFPFQVVSDTDPLARLIEGRFMTDGGSELLKVFLYVQRDWYLLNPDELRPITNPEIDHLWQRGFSFYSRGPSDRSPKVFSHQIDEKGRVLPFQSLFFCATKQLFFPPPCPHCGSPLEQCYEDDLLNRSGLEPYSTSLRRYLFCSSCSAEREFPFYAYERQETDPSRVKGRSTLIMEFAQLAQGKKQVALFPCVACSQHQECYGPQPRVLSRVTPFSFYPFYLLIFEAMSLNAKEFLSLLSGASLDQLETLLGKKRETGRAPCLKALRQSGLVKHPVLFEEGEKCFLEVLYLKLSFLGELLRRHFAGEEWFKHPDLKPSIDQIWVKLKDQSGLLPAFWNFDVTLIDLGRGPSDPPTLPQVPSHETLYFLGRIWFYALLVNQKQSMSQVFQALGEGMTRFFSDMEFSFEGFLKGNRRSTFLPENIFWDPEAKTVPPGWEDLWERSLHLGWTLLRSSCRLDPGWSLEGFWQESETLRGAIKTALFPPGQDIESRRDQPRPIVKSEAEDGAISEILRRIGSKWRSELETPREESKETVLISPGKVETEPKRIEDLEETVILSSEKLRQGVSPPPSPPEEREESVSETVILSPSTLAQEKKKGKVEPKEIPVTQKEKKDVSPETGKPPPGDDIMAETIILGPKKVRDKEKDGKKE